MRTTIRLSDDRRESLLSLAEERGDKGVSRVVEEAVSFYLAERAKPVLLAPTVPPTPVAAPGRWQLLGADLDRHLGADTGVLATIRALVRGGLERLPARIARPG